VTEDDAESRERSASRDHSAGRATAPDEERVVPDQPTAGDPRPETDDDSAVDRAAESFVHIEADLRDLSGNPGRRYGLATDVERVSARTVPADYPIRITTDEALRLRVQGVDHAEHVPEAAASVYFEWPPADHGALARLLALRDIDLDEFADLHGERVPLAVENGYLVPRLPPGGRRGDPRGVYGIVGGLAVNLFVLGLIAFGFGGALTSPLGLLVLAVANFLMLPVATYLDARHLLTTTDWNQGPPFWAALAALPGVNVVSSLAYLYTRENATPV